MFRQAFGDIHPYFIENLHKSFASLTRGEELLSALLLLNYSCHDIAEILGISESSVYINRHRLRKKLSMSKDADLKELINSFDRKL
jgi:AraC family chitin signaling transcriptional activator